MFVGVIWILQELMKMELMESCFLMSNFQRKSENCTQLDFLNIQKETGSFMEPHGQSDTFQLGIWKEIRYQQL